MIRFAGQEYDTWRGYRFLKEVQEERGARRRARRILPKDTMIMLNISSDLSRFVIEIAMLSKEFSLFLEKETTISIQIRPLLYILMNLLTNNV